MNTLPFRLDITNMAERIKASDFRISLSILQNIIRHADEGILPVSDIIELGKKLKLSTTELTKYISQINTEAELFAFASFIKRLKNFGLVCDYTTICANIKVQLVEIYRNL